MTVRSKISCNTIEYRKGFIEVAAGIHPGCLNIETWNVRPEVNIPHILTSATFDIEGLVTGNTELELSITEAENFIAELQRALSQVRLQQG